MAARKKAAAAKGRKASPRTGSRSKKELVAKKLRTGEIAVWDPTTKSVMLLSKPGKETVISARIISGASFHAMNEALGDVIVLV